MKPDRREKGTTTKVRTRRVLENRFRKKYGKVPHDPQLDIDKVSLYMLDYYLLIVGTGMGKMIPKFMLPIHRGKHLTPFSMILFNIISIFVP
jgi:hypothetical protein